MPVLDKCYRNMICQWKSNEYLIKICWPVPYSISFCNRWCVLGNILWDSASEWPSWSWPQPQALVFNHHPSSIIVIVFPLAGRSAAFCSSDYHDWIVLARGDQRWNSLTSPCISFFSFSNNKNWCNWVLLFRSPSSSLFYRHFEILPRFLFTSSKECAQSSVISPLPVLE